MYMSLRLNSAAWLLLLPISVGTLYAQEPSVEQNDSFADARRAGRERSRFIQEKEPASSTVPKSRLDEFAKSIKPILQQSCVHCHGEETQEGNVRIDTLDPDLLNGKDIDWWLEVQAVLSKGEMPPPDETELADADRAKIIEWLSNEIQTASIVRRANGEHSSFRRMTRYEFNYALQDLLGLPYNFAKDLPPKRTRRTGSRTVPICCI